MERNEPDSKRRRRPKSALRRHRVETLLRSFAEQLATHDGPVPLEEVTEIAEDVTTEWMKIIDRYSLNVVPKADNPKT